MDEPKTPPSPAKLCLICSKEYSSQLNSCPIDGGQLIPTQRDPFIGTVFADRYQILSTLGKGGMSVVYKARHLYMERMVAVKVLLSHLLVDNAALERFRKESKAASSLAHQNIIAVYDFGVTPAGQPYLVMDCLEGPTLSDVLVKEKRILPGRAIDILKQVSDGLDHAHRKGIIHRDLKPSNLVLLSQDNGTELVKIVDFGVAKLLYEDAAAPGQQRLTQTGEVFGSPLYMSPEQCTGAPLDGRSDIYSLGCLMYEAISGVSPFAGNNAMDTMSKHLGEPPTPFGHLSEDLEIPDELEEIVFKCLEKDPNNRFQSASELRGSIPSVFHTQEPIASSTGKPFNLSQRKKTQEITSRNNPMASSPMMRSSGRRQTQSWADVKHSESDQPVADRRSSKWTMYVGAVVFLSWLLFVVYWPGPEGDQGPIFRKMLWTGAMYLAQRADELKQYPLARELSQRAMINANAINDNHTRVLATLNLQSEIYGDSGMFPEQEEVNKAIVNLQNDQLLHELRHKLKYLRGLSGQGGSDVAASMSRFKAEANADRITNLARRLFAAGRYDDEVNLLKEAEEAYVHLTGPDYYKLSDFYTEHAEALISEQRTPEVRPFLARSLDIRIKAKGQDSPGAIRALLRLGQWDRDKSNWPDALKELSGALNLASTKTPDDSSLIVNCLNSYADYFQQIGQKDEAGKLFIQAQQLARKSR